MFFTFFLNNCLWLFLVFFVCIVMDEYDYDYDYDEPFLQQPAIVIPEEQHFEENNFQMVFENCIQPSVASVIQNIADLIMYNLLFNVFTQTGRIWKTLKQKIKPLLVGIIRKSFGHAVSFILGTILLGSMSCPVKFCIFISFLISSYAVVYTSHKLCKGYNFSATSFSMAVLIISLLFWFDIKRTLVKTF